MCLSNAYEESDNTLLMRNTSRKQISESSGGSASQRMTAIPTAPTPFRISRMLPCTVPYASETAFPTIGISPEASSLTDFDASESAADAACGAVSAAETGAAAGDAAAIIGARSMNS